MTHVPSAVQTGRVLSVTACMAGACCSPRDYYMICDTFMKAVQKVARPNLITISIIYDRRTYVQSSETEAEQNTVKQINSVHDIVTDTCLK